MNATTPEQITLFAAAVFDPSDCVEIREIRGTEVRSTWHAGADLEVLPDACLTKANASGWQIYVGVNPRIETEARGDANVLLARTIFADFDHTTLADAMAAWKAAGLPAPTLIVASGHGWHFYLRLAVPMDDLAAWRTFQDDLARLLHSDPKVKNPERIMRLPGFQNLKSDPVPCEIVEVDCTRRYAFEDLRAIVPTPPIPQAKPRPAATPSGNDDRVKRCRAYLAKLPPAVSGQGGHDQTFQAASECFRFGLSESEAAAEMDAYNARCLPPWTEKELAHKIQSARANCNGDFGIHLRERSNTRQNRASGKLTKPTSPDAEPLEPVATCDDAMESIPLGHREPTTGKLVLSPSRTLPTADAYVDQFHKHADGRTVHSYAGNFLEWRGNRYGVAEDDSFRQKLQPWLHDALRYRPLKDGAMELVPFESNPRTGNAALDSIRAKVHVTMEITPPVWLDGGENRPDPRELLSTPSGNLHVATGRMHPPSPLLFNFNAIDFEHDPHAPPPQVWLAFLHALWASDQESIDALQEIFGYLLVADTSQQKMFLLAGPKRSGKGTLARVLTRLVGAGNVVGPTTSSLAGPFGLQPLIGKSVAIVSDARFTGESVGIVVERLLCISGEDTLTVDQKFKTSLTMKLGARFVFLSNELPKMNDASGALAGRFIVLRLTQSFYGREDTSLTAKLLAELPSILNWAIEGLKRLRQRGHFVQPASAADAIREIEDLGSPIGAFVRDFCDVGPGKSIPTAELFSAWQQWCKSQGRDRAGTIQTFGRDLRAAVAGLKVKQPNDVGTRTREYEGIDLNTTAHASIAAELAERLSHGGQNGR